MKNNRLVIKLWRLEDLKMEGLKSNENLDAENRETWIKEMKDKTRNEITYKGPQIKAESLPNLEKVQNKRVLNAVIVDWVNDAQSGEVYAISLSTLRDRLQSDPSDISQSDLRKYEFDEVSKIKNDFDKSSKMMGLNWVQGFLRQNSGLSLRNPERPVLVEL
ncbi:hypothetical protein FQA39_LY16346 [Lamprigera yunnana]|nr:hypothetical protein FQA39_LY16346 [Lamprigera yunnana]